LSSLKVYKSAYSELVSKPGNKEGCGRKSIQHKNTFGHILRFLLLLSVWLLQGS